MPDPSVILGGATLTIKATTANFNGGGVAVFRGIGGEFGILGTSVLAGIMSPPTNLWVARGRTKYAILGPGGGDVIGPRGDLTLDWVKDAQPFAWTSTSPPNLLTLDWTKDGQPFASNDFDIIPANGAASLSILAATSMTRALQGASTLNIDATINVFHGSTVWTTVASLTILAVAHIPLASWRYVKPCEIPGPVLTLTSNLPFGVWQANPDAIFTWEPVFTCAKQAIIPPKPVPVTGYFWVMDRNPTTAVNYDNGTFTKLTWSEIHLDHQPYGVGSWWFHLCPVNWAGIGPTIHYNVDYDVPPTIPGVTGMWIDGLDTLTHIPLVAEFPVTPHQLTWSISLGPLVNQIVNYEVQVSQTADFGINHETGLAEIVVDAQNLPTALYNLGQLAPGLYFWRIRAWDGFQNSLWGPIGRFRVNAPPLRPFDLSVIQTV